LETSSWIAQRQCEEVSRSSRFVIGARKLKADQRTVLNIAAAVLAMVPIGNFMAWMRFQTRKRNRFDLWMICKILSYRKRIAGVALQAEVQGLKPLKEEEAIEWRKRRADVTHPLQADLEADDPAD
jgi:hypothetical protein